MKVLRAMAIVVSAVLLLCSCELMYKAPDKGTLRILVYGNDYYGNGSYSTAYDDDNVFIGYAKRLTATINDAVCTGNALVSSAEKANMDYQITYLIGPSTTYNSEALVPGAVVNDVTRSTLIGTLQSFADSAKDGDLTIIYFSGHGFGKEEKLEFGSDTAKMGSLVLQKDTDMDSVILSVSDFLSLVSLIPGSKVVIGDFCYSGSLVQSGNVAVTDGEYTGMEIEDLFDLRDGISIDPSLFCLSASRYYEKSWESGYHGYFTKALLKGLGWDETSRTISDPAAAVNSRITFFNLARYCMDNDREARQTPMFSDGSNDIVLFQF